MYLQCQWGKVKENNNLDSGSKSNHTAQCRSMH